jgi:hypothetical protein
VGNPVVMGIATEASFEDTPSGLLEPTITRDLACGTSCVSVDSDTHQVSNLQGPDRDLVTLHDDLDRLSTRTPPHMLAEPASSIAPEDTPWQQRTRPPPSISPPPA